jgi:hypothetical protein
MEICLLLIQPSKLPKHGNVFHLHNEASGPSQNGSLCALLRQKMVFSRAAELIGVWGHLDPF